MTQRFVYADSRCHLVGRISSVLDIPDELWAITVGPIVFPNRTVGGSDVSVAANHRQFPEKFSSPGVTETCLGWSCRREGLR